jgi:hypothetical protein
MTKVIATATDAEGNVIAEAASDHEHGPTAVHEANAALLRQLEAKGAIKTPEGSGDAQGS